MSAFALLVALAFPGGSDARCSTSTPHAQDTDAERKLARFKSRYRKEGASPSLLQSLRRFKASLPLKEADIRSETDAMIERVERESRKARAAPIRARLDKLKRRADDEDASRGLLKAVRELATDIPDSEPELKRTCKRLERRLAAELHLETDADFEQRIAAAERRFVRLGSSRELAAETKQVLQDLESQSPSLPKREREARELLTRIRSGLEAAARKPFEERVVRARTRLARVGPSERLLRETEAIMKDAPESMRDIKEAAGDLHARVKAGYQRLLATRFEKQVADLERQFAQGDPTHAMRQRANSVRKSLTELEQSWTTTLTARIDGLLERNQPTAAVARRNNTRRNEPRERAPDSDTRELVQLRDELVRLKKGLTTRWSGIYVNLEELIANCDATISARSTGAQGPGVPVDATSGSAVIEVPEGWRLPPNCVRRGKYFYVEGNDPSPMVLVVPGRFSIGRRPAGNDMAPFLIDVYEVTVERYRNFAKKRNDATDGNPHWDRVGYDYPSQAVVGMNLHDARRFARWAGKDVPRSEEWLYAATWNSTRGRWQRYSWGDRFPAQLKARDFPPLVTEATFDLSPWGVRGMGTGVREWCEADKFRIEVALVRGPEHITRLASPNLEAPLSGATETLAWRYRARDIGFRCVCRLVAKR